MSATLLVLAAGIGSRFKGGIKQLTPIGPSDELIMEYSVYDAVKAGFDRVVFIIRREIEQQFRENIGDRLSAYVNVSYCFQETECIPGGFTASDGRVRPWGTVHAVLAAEKLLDEPFLIINADDYYGRDAFASIYEFLTDKDRSAHEQCMGGFIIKNTLSTTGAVTRGICSCDENGMLTSVCETYGVTRNADGTIRGRQGDNIVTIPEESVVSMNMWGCTKEFVPLLTVCFEKFLERAEKTGSLDTAEYPIPLAVDELIGSGMITVKVIPTHDCWYGMTHKEDCPGIRAAFAEMTEKGIYPSPLFG